MQEDRSSAEGRSRRWGSYIGLSLYVPKHVMERISDGF